MGSDRAMEQLVQVAKTGALWWEVVYRPVALLEQPGSYRSQNPRASALPRGERFHIPFLLHQPLSLCWCLGPKGVGRGLTGPRGPSLGVCSSRA